MTSWPPVRISPALLAEAERIAALRERLQAASVDLGAAAALQKEGRLLNAQAHCRLAGHRLSLDELRQLDEGGEPSPDSSAAAQTARQWLALLHWLQAPSGPPAVTADEVVKMQRLLSEDAGAAAALSPFAAPGGPMASDSRVPPALGRLLDGWQHEASELSPVLSAALLHRLAARMPSAGTDNEAFGRALAHWERIRRGHDPLLSLTVDAVYAGDARGYLAALNSAGNAHGADCDGDDAWLLYSARALRTAFEQAWLRLQAIRGAAGADGGRIALRPRQQQLLQLLRDRGSLAPSEIWAALSISRQGAIELLRPLLAAGLVERVGGAKTGHYVLRQP